MSTAALPLPADGNPIQSDATLQTLLRKLDKIQKYKTFQRWKGKFLDRLTEFLYQSGMDPATKRCDHFKQLLATFIAQADKVTRFIEKDELGENRKTVKAALALQEMCKQLTTLVEFMRVLIPSRKSEEKQCGFSKFHLGASLIRQGFQQYTTMMAMDDALTEITQRVGSVADRQQLELFDMYRLQVQRFCDVMADLHLYEVMIKCVEFAEAPEEEESSDEEDIHIEITVVDGATKKKIKLEVDPNEKIGNIKQAIANDCGIPPSKQVIKFREKELNDNNSTLKREGVDNNAKLTVEPFKVPIQVKNFDGKKIDLYIDPDLVYMSDLKRMLEKESGIPGLNQQLSMGGKELDNDFLLACDYDIVENSILDLQPKAFGVTVRMPDGTEHPLDITIADTAESIKEKVQTKTGMPIPKQVLKHQQKVMPNGETAASLGIQAGALLNVEIFQVPVIVNLWDGRSINILVDPTWHIRVLKRNLEDESGVPAGNQRLYDNEKIELAVEMKTAGEYGVKEGSILFLEPKSISVSVKMPDGSCYEITIAPDATVDSIKKTLESLTGMPTVKQLLKFKENELFSGQHIGDAGIEDGSRLTVDLFTVPVAVHTYDGNVINIHADPHASIGAMKMQLESQSGIEASNQRLSMRESGSELGDDNAVASDCGIEGGTELYLEPKSMSVDVHLPDGSTKSIRIRPSDTVAEIKEHIAMESGIIPASQVLKCGGNTLANDNDNARELGIRDGSTLRVELFQVPIMVYTFDGKVINIMADPHNTIRALKENLEPESGISPSNQHLSRKGDDNVFCDDNAKACDHGIVAGSELYLEPKVMSLIVQLPDGSTSRISLSPSDTVSCIKDKIAHQSGLTPARQLLFFEGKQLVNDGEKAKDIGLRDGSTVNVELFTVPMVVHTYDGRSIEIKADPHDTIGAIKELLEPESGLAPSNQRLSFKNESEEIANDGAVACDVGIAAGSELYLEPKTITVTVELPDRSTTEISVSPSDTVMDIKNKIANKTGIAAQRQVLNSDGKTLKNDCDTARAIGIREDSRLKVGFFTVPVTVHTMDGNQIIVNVDPSGSLGDFKLQLEPESGLEAHNQTLRFPNGNELPNDSKTMADYGIAQASELYLFPKGMEINVVTPNGDRHSLSVSPFDKEADIKAKIEKKTGIAVARQSLKHAGKTMGDSITAHEFGLRHGSDINVDIKTIPIVVRTMDGTQIHMTVEPTESLFSLKEKIHLESAIVPSNQRLSMNGSDVVGDKKLIDDLGIKTGSVIDLEPKLFSVNVTMPDGSNHSISVAPSDTSTSIKNKIEEKTGLASPRQVLRFGDTVVPANGQTVRDMGIVEGSQLFVDLFKFQVTVKTHDGRRFDLSVEPSSLVSAMKEQIRLETSVEPKKQCLMLGQNELTDNQRTINACGVKAGSTLFLDIHADPIIFVDIKCGTLFAMDREIVIAQTALNPLQGNKLDFLEASKESEARDKIKSAMMGSPRLGFATQVVVEKNEVEDYELGEAEKVKNMWGVNLKKREKNKKGEELIFVDPKTGACGELSRKKMLDMEFITPIDTGKGESLAEAETDTMQYDKYIIALRGVFGVSVAK